MTNHVHLLVIPSHEHATKLNQSALKDIREALNPEFVSAREYFKTKIAELTKRQTRTNNPGRPRIEVENAVC